LWWREQKTHWFVLDVDFVRLPMTKQQYFLNTSIETRMMMKMMVLLKKQM
jgi:hypothetical protein